MLHYFSTSFKNASTSDFKNYLRCYQEAVKELAGKCDNTCDSAGPVSRRVAELNKTMNQDTMKALLTATKNLFQ